MRLRARPLVGQTFDDIEKAAERLRTAVGASRVRTDPLGPNEAVLTLTMGDALAAPFNASCPTPADPVMGGRVAMGRVEDGATWMLPLGPHTLVAGCSGAGKGSVFWSFAFGLAPAVRAGLVRLHGVDLKGGMEILMGAGLFTKRATNAAEAVVLLEALVTDMRERTRAYAGRVRSHTAAKVDSAWWHDLRVTPESIQSRRDRCVLFDVEGTLIDAVSNQRRVWAEWSTRHELHPDDVYRVALRTRPLETFEQVAPDLDPLACLAEFHAL